MATQLTNYQCPACTGPLHFDGASGKLVCDFCGSSYDTAEIEALYAEKEAAAETAAQNKQAPPPDSVWSENEAAGLRSYSCPSCGAELICDETTAATSCPYCGNPTVIAGQFSGMQRPELVLPFVLDKNAAKAALKKYYRGKRFLPNAFSSQNHIKEIKGVYVPFWLFDANASGSGQYEATTSSSHRNGDYVITTTKHYDVRRAGTTQFMGVPVDGSTKMPNGHMDAIEPFDYDALRPFSVAYMPGYIANRYDEDCETCKARAERRMEESTISALRETVVDEYDDATVESKQLDYTWEDSDYALFPVWMLSTSWNGKSCLFAMNGQAGRLVGELPCSKPKLAIASVLFFVIGFILSQILFMGEYAFDPDYLTFDIEGILINVIAPLIIVIIGDVLLVGQLKTANEATHADEYCGELDLTEKHDTFSHTETTVVMKDDKDD